MIYQKLNDTAKEVLEGKFNSLGKCLYLKKEKFQITYPSTLRN